MFDGGIAEDFKLSTGTLASGGTLGTQVVGVCPPYVLDAGEMTDKGYINQRAVLDNRSATVSALHAATAPDGIIVI